MKRFLPFVISGFIVFFILAIPVSVNMIIKKSNEKSFRTESVLPVRKPAVAGSFYTSNKDQLKNSINSYLNQAQKIIQNGKLRILIVPHAGLDYSGRVAGWGFKQLEGEKYSRIIIIGASHQMGYPYAAVYDQGPWETPLGLVPVENNFISQIPDDQNVLILDSKPHKPEHSLEMEVIFLQTVLPSVPIVPILLGQVSEDTIGRLASKLATLWDDNTLIVISSDLSHYPDSDLSHQIDKKTIESIISGSPEIFKKTIENQEKLNLNQVVTLACGSDAILAALILSQKLDIGNWQEIKYENSGDVTGDIGRVVGYAAIGATRSQKSEIMIDQKARTEALDIARSTLNSFIRNKTIPSVQTDSQILKNKLGAFVTLKINNMLRGCIGEFEPNKPLSQVIRDMTIEAAIRDPRFNPVTVTELPDIKIEISVLTPKRKIQDWREIELGKHGVLVQKGMSSGTFLPQVADESGWTKEEFLRQLCSQKAGLDEDCYRDPNVNLYVYEAIVFEEQS